MVQRITDQEFIQRSQDIHGGKYDYSLTTYKSSSTYVTIICPAHGEFKQRASNHLAGRGCQKCSGNEKLTTSQFIAKAKEIHGDKYDYRLLNYVNANTKIKIICPEHGVFYQTPDNHANNSRGCPKCGGSEKLDTSEFIKRARSIHGDRYRYSKTAYKNSNCKVIITCPAHGDFMQAPNHHLQGKGCRDCSYSLRAENLSMGKDEFLKRAIDLHKGLYDYSLVQFVNASSPVAIICPGHGVFYQLPSVHLRPAGCKACATRSLGQERRKTTQQFINEAISVHGNRYDYLKTIYQSSRDKLVIICSVHGEFEQVPYSHLIGNGCGKCADFVRADKKRSSKAEFIDKAEAIHGQRYSYNNSSYLNMHTAVEILCSEHGPFMQKPSNHLSGNGCPSCAHSGIDLSAPGILYYLRVEDKEKTYWKIGITNRTVKDRFMSDMENIHIIMTWRYDPLEEGFRKEQEILSKFSANRIKDDVALLKRGGNTELFAEDVLGLDEGYL